MQKRFSKISSTISYFLILLSLVSPVFAQEQIDAAEFISPLRRMFNLALMLAAGVLFVMLVFGALKMASALGDPKGWQGASLTWTWGVLGFLIIVGFFALYRIIVGVFGFGDATSPDAFFTNLEVSIDAFLDTYVYH